MDAVEPGEGSDRRADASPASAPPPSADEAKMETVDASAAVEVPAAVRGAKEAGEGIAADPDHAVGPSVSEMKMEVDEGSAVGEEHSAVSRVNEGSIPGEVRDLAPVVSEAKMVVDEGGAACEEHSVAALAVSEVNKGIVQGKVQDVAPEVSEVKMEVDEGDVASKEHSAALAASEVNEGSILEQGRTVAAVASEVKMEEGEGRAVNQEPTTPAGSLQVKKEVGECLVGHYIGRSAPGYGRILIGKVASYDSATGMYGVLFEDGHGEDLGLPQLRELLMAEENGSSGMKLSCRKRKLDLLVSSGSASEVKGPASTRQRVDVCEISARPDAPQQSGSGSDMSEDVESSSNSSDFTKEEPSEPCPPVQAVELPPSSGDIAVPEESISYLFSVYNFLRSFSVQLFLGPFGLDDFVAAISCTVQNNLLDAVHVSLLRALRRHLETKSSEGSQLASNCLKYLDWALLDTLTWPTFLLEYLYVMGCIKNLGGRSFGRSLLAIEYYKLPVAMKLRVLQILCDHVIDSEELKTELEDREGYNEEMEYETDSSVFLEAGSRAVSTRATKASAYKRINDLQNLETALNATNPEAVVANASQDGNSDDCRICGMDGTLVCCDGCPWAYHSRCIGLNKAFLPQGEWFCPECVVNKLGPTSSRIERGARGAQMFGIDMCRRLFLGSCNYLLVIGTSSNAESYARYYNHYDVVKVLQILAHSDAYMDICRRIKEYWKHLLDIFQSERSKIGKEVSTNQTPQSNMLSFTPMKAGDGSVRRTLKDGGDSMTVALPQTNARQDFVANQYTICSAEHLKEQKCMTSLGAVTEKNNEVCRQTLSAQNNIYNAPRNGAFASSVVSSISHHNGSIVTGVPNIAQAQPAQNLFCPDLSTCVSGINGMPKQGTVSTISAKAESFYPSYQGKDHLQLIAERFGNISGGKPAKLSSFKPQAYMNLYNHGYIAACAAANLAVIASDEGKVSASQLATNPRKKMAADNALQMKAFSSAAAQFVWPSTEKKLMEVPRDRCGWCLACRSSAIGNKKACFLNMATTNAAKGSARFLSVMRLIKNSDSHFPSIVAYLANMEESLCGLLVGSLQDTQQKQRWHKQLQEASNCRTVVPLLLELESNIRGLAFSASWSKLIDDWPVESPGVSIGASRPAAYQKRGTGGKRGRKRSLASESATATDDDNSWTWWSRGNISKRILQRGALLSSTIRKAAREGGKKRIAGLSYHEGSNLPRRTRQFAWRACVGLSQNSSQLALQVRYLDAHIRWKEFIPPDQIPSDGKSSDGDFSALRNAVVCGKKIVDNKIRYALKFPNQKHLPVRVTKNILEAEDTQDKHSKMWFSENHVPLYMVREFEQEAGVSSLPTPGMLDANCFTNFYPRRVKAFTRDIFSYLFHKGDVYPCTSCKKDVPFRDVVKCSSCQGNCHKECTTRSVGSKGGNTTSNLICKLCLQKRNLMLTSYNTNASYIRPQQKSNGQQPVTAPKIIFKVGSSHSAEPAMKVKAQPVAKVEAQPFVKVEPQPIANVEAQPLAKVEAQPLAKVDALPITNLVTQNMTSVQAQPKTKSKKSKPEKPRKPKKVQAITYFGLVWKKNKNDSDGSDFRANDVILKSKDGMGSSIKPVCCLCNKTYSPDFLYVRCERCRNWFHGDALQIEEEKIFELVAYRCCRCRRRAIPQCPHSDDYMNPEPEISEQTVATLSQATMPSSEETFALADQDPLLASYGIVEPIGEETADADISMSMASFTPGINQKLSIRRAQVKNCEDLDQVGRPVNEYYIQNQPPGNASISFSHMNEFSLSEADSVDASELLGWDFSQGTAYAAPPDLTANYESNDTSCGSFAMEEFEPQTYFSFTELLEADETQLDNAFGISTGLQGDGNCSGSFDQQGVSFDEMAFMVEDESSNMNLPTNDPSSDEVACNKCKNPQPPPDLKCAVCGLHIHRHCSPWEESAQPAESANWSCGACREWR
ncbi:DDT domain-containing protein PTM-like [Phragmites australis]|uniref:DDT domain-containing protein PTM-like n=1 Tax=Phragmites australis TaxID=29695 RepID=UPI002D76FCCA|nr:DDT domain-containing protein PTM-like [Phragmites australis]